MAGGHNDAKLEEQENPEEIKAKALEACAKLLKAKSELSVPVESECLLKLVEIDDFKTQVVAGTNYIMDLTASCGDKQYVCEKLTIHEPLKHVCPQGLCLESTFEDRVELKQVGNSGTMMNSKALISLIITFCLLKF